MTLHRHNSSAGVLRALAVSILIHGLVLWAGQDLPGAGSGMATPAALRVQVAGPTATTAAPAGALAEPQSPRRSRQQPALVSPTRETADAPPGASVAESSPERAAGSVPASTSETARGTPPTVSPAVPRPGPDADGLRQYRLALGVQAGRFKRYPASARAAGWEGRVVLHVVVAAAGAPVSLSLARSSGHDLLDEAALEMMRLAAARTPLPESLRGQALAFDLPVDYSLRDE